MNVKEIGTIFVFVVAATAVLGAMSHAAIAEGAGAEGALRLTPGDALDYKKLAFFPDRWEKQNVDTTMYPWEGRRIVFLTNTADLDPQVMASFVDKLDRGWECYHRATGKTPQPLKTCRGKPIIAAIPGGNLTCGYGCGYNGATGIEVCGFYQNDYRQHAAGADNFSHYYFYEMGRNYYVYGGKHSLFFTGFAVFMRYVCMDDQQLTDPDLGTRRTIEAREADYAASNVSWFDAFTPLSGKGGNRLTGNGGKPLGLSDENVLYCSIMLKLRKQYGDEFASRFYKQLDTCPAFNGKKEEGAVGQAANWAVAASAAAREDLGGLFQQRWKFPLSDKVRTAIAAADLACSETTAGKIVADTLDKPETP